MSAMNPFLRLGSAKAPARLREAVLARIEGERIRSARRRFAIDTCAAFLSGFLFVPAAKRFAAEAASSGAFAYLKLLLTDGAAYWQDAAFSFLEALPALSAAAAIAACLALLVSLQRAILDGAIAFHRRHATN